MATMRAVQIGRRGGDFEVVDREIPAPGPGEVRVRVSACGVCHSDMFAKEGGYPTEYPIIPGHEIAGVVGARGRASTAGRPASGSGSDGSAATAATASGAGGAGSSTARTCRSRV
jgi:D-arabinose 1-dehydrogenase-like Zn-dependent alcohol dehydrogenase